MSCNKALLIQTMTFVPVRIERSFCIVLESVVSVDDPLSHQDFLAHIDGYILIYDRDAGNNVRLRFGIYEIKNSKGY